MYENLFLAFVLFGLCNCVPMKHGIPNRRSIRLNSDDDSTTSVNLSFSSSQSYLVSNDENFSQVINYSISNRIFQETKFSVPNTVAAPVLPNQSSTRHSLNHPSLNQEHPVLLPKIVQTSTGDHDLVANVEHYPTIKVLENNSDSNMSSDHHSAEVPKIIEMLSQGHTVASVAKMLDNPLIKSDNSGSSSMYPLLQSENTGTLFPKINEEPRIPKKKMLKRIDAFTKQLYSDPNVGTPDHEEKKTSKKGAEENIEEIIREEKENMELKMKVETDLEDYHQLKQRIQFLEIHLKNHADLTVVSTSELLGAAHSLQEVKDKIIKPLEINLIAVKDQIDSLDHRFNLEEKKFIKSVIENADGFLKTSKKRIDQLELLNQNWSSEEEAELINEAIHRKPISKFRNQKASTDEEMIMDEEEYSTGLRTGKLQRIHNLVGEKNLERLENNEEHETLNIDIHKLKQDLEREKMMDAEPGYNKKIKAAFDEAAEKSHKFVEKLSHPHSGAERPSWLIVIILAVISGALLITVLCLITVRCKKIPTNLFSKKEENNLTYCELNDVQFRDNRTEEQPGSDGWQDQQWTSWANSARDSQKLK